MQGSLLEKLDPERSALSMSGLRGRVVDARGDGIAEAQLQWIAPTSTDMRWEAGWQAEDWGPLLRSEVRTVSDASGNFNFDQAPRVEGLLGSAIWASALGFEANCLLLGAGENAPPTLTLKAAPSIQVRVEDTAGNPLAGVWVEQFGLTPRAAPVEMDGRLDPERLRRLLMRTAASGPDGTLVLAAFPGEQVLRARSEKRLSVPWRGSAPSQVTLRLQASFRLGGRIELPDWSDLNYEGERRILVGIQEGSQWRGLATLRGVAQGEWGPLELPWMEDKLYSAKLEGSPIIPITQTFKAPAAGDELRLDFRAELGSAVWVCGLDADEQLIPGVTATVWWDQDGVRQSLTRRAPLGSPYANPWSMPPCELFFSVSAPGYAPGTGGPISLPEAEPRAHPVRLRKAGRLRGSVTYQGRPVEDFELMVWLKSNRQSDQTIPFHGRQDGSFEIDTAPLGEVAVSASAGYLPPADYQLVQIPEEGSARVTIELAAPSVGIGRVVDLDNGQAIPMARLQVSMFLEGRDLGPYGPPGSTRSDGAFRLENLLPGPNLVRVSAPGYAPAFLNVLGASGREVDCGTVVLARPRSLELRLVSSDPSHDFGAYSAVIGFPKLLPLTRFGVDGVLRCEVAASGNFSIQIMRGDLQQASIKTAFFPGEPWVLEHRVGDGRRVSGRVLPSESMVLSEVSLVSLLYSDRPGFKTTLLGAIDEHGAFQFDDVPGPTASVSVQDARLAFIGQASGAFQGAEDLILNPQLGAHPLRICIQDKQGEPIALAGVGMRERGGAPFFHFSTTDENGEMLGYGLPELPVDVFVQHPKHGFGMFQQQGASGDVVYRLQNDSSLGIRVLDGEVPLPGARVAVSDAQGERMFAYQSAGFDGQLRLLGHSAGRYRLLATHPQCWPVLFEAEARPDSSPTDVQLRRLGNLVLCVTDVDGLPLAGLPVSLSGDWEGGDVAAWIREGRVTAGAQLTAQDGCLRVDGLPHGTYRWSIAEQSGSFRVRPLETNHVSLVLGR